VLAVLLVEIFKEDVAVGSLRQDGAALNGAAQILWRLIG
jgi:hypothetical protein